MATSALDKLNKSPSTWSLPLDEEDNDGDQRTSYKCPSAMKDAQELFLLRVIKESL